MVSTRLQCNSHSSGEPSRRDALSTAVCTRLQLHQNLAAEAAAASSADVVSTSKPSTSSCVTRSTAAVVNAAAPAASTYVSNKTFLDLPDEIVQKIVGYTGLKNVATMRQVCRHMNYVCGDLLNSTFNKLQTLMLNRFHSIKAQMPRRESARRQHPLACEFDIVETIHMRLNLLNMTFGKHIERKLICFFPGDVLDEVYRILYYISVTKKLPRPYRVTDELFDLTTMAMEHFKEVLEPNLPEITYTCGMRLVNYSPKPRGGSRAENSRDAANDNQDVNVTVDEEFGNSYAPQSNMVLRKRIRKIKEGMKLYNSQLTTMKRDLKTCKTKMADQQKTILEYAARLDENDKKNEEISRKFSTLLQELNKCKTELQYWRSKSPFNPVCGTCGSLVSTVPVEDLEVLSNQNQQPQKHSDDKGVMVPEAEPPPVLEDEIEKGGSMKTITSSYDQPVSSKMYDMANKSMENPGPSSSVTWNDEISKVGTTVKRKQPMDKSPNKRRKGILKLRNKSIRK